MKLKWVLFFIGAISLVNSAQAQKARDYAAVMNDLAAKLRAAHLSNQPIRLAVVPLVNTQSSYSNRFGEYVTESLISKLSDQPGKYTVFERKRLDAILREDELILSDLMLPEAAQKIGQLAPIDALFSGTYTKLKTYVDISARLIDVTSGEIRVSFSGRIKMTRNLRILFPVDEEKENSTPLIVTQQPKQKANDLTISKGPSNEERCKQYVKDFQIKLNDLSTKERVDAVVKEAMRTPFDNQWCGKLHYEVLYSLQRFKIKSGEYDAFLLATMDTIRYPSLDDRSYQIIRFLSSDSIVDAKEWKVGLKTISRIGDYTLSNYLSYLLARTKSTADESHQRIDAYFQLVNAQKIGLPKPIGYNQAFFEMMEGVRPNQALRKYVYENYSRAVALDVKSAGTIYSTLHSMYQEEEDRAEKTRIIHWIADFFLHHEDEKSHEHLYDMAGSFGLHSNDARNREIMAEFPESDLKILVERCKDQFSTYALKTPYPNQQEDRIHFCVKYEIPIPGTIPTMSEAEVILNGNNLNEQLRVMKLLVQMNDRPRPLENTLVNLFSKRSLEDKATLNTVQSMAVIVLGNMKTANSKAIDYMVATLSYFSQEADYATEALIAIGKPSVNALIKKLNSTTDQDGGVRYRIIVILGKIGPDAKAALPVFKKIMNENRNEDVRYAIEAAMQSIQ